MRKGLLLTLFVVPFLVKAQTPLMISEYVEGSSNNKAVELYNNSAQQINLADYVLFQFNNGASASSGTRYALTFTNPTYLAPGRTYVIVNNSAGTALKAYANLLTTNSALNFNGDDGLAIYNATDVTGTTINNNNPIDILGQIGFDPGTEWGTGLASTADNTIRRKSTVYSTVTVNPGSFAPATEYDGYATDVFEGLGYHNMGGTITSSTSLPARAYTDITINGAGITVSFSGPSKITRFLSVLDGTLQSNGNLTLQSLSDSTAYISAVGATGSITGTVTTEKYIAGGGLSTASPSQRAYRFLAHPFSSAIALSQLQTAIDITGTGTGFDASGSGAASAFTWNQATANGNIGGSGDGGWNAITNTTTANWAQYKAMRVFYRGTKGTGLNGSAYTVGSATLSMSGTVNTGNQTINLTYPNNGTTSNYNFVGNPYASNVQMSGVTNTATTSSYYVWNLALGSRGGYSTVSFGSSYVLPAYAGFFVEANGASPSLVFHEADKTSSAATNTLLRENNNGLLNIQIKSGSILWDELQLESNKQANAAYEYADAKKLKNLEVSLYTITNDNVDLAIDKRNIQVGDIIPLGLSSNASRTFTMEFGTMNINNVELYLHDKYLGTEQRVEAGSTYTFSTSTDAASQGNARFELVAKQAPVVIVAPSMFTVKLAPNPTTEYVKVAFTNEEELSTTIQVIDAQGKVVSKVNAGKQLSGEVKINVNRLSKGSYFVLLNNGKQTRTEKLQVQ